MAHHTQNMDRFGFNHRLTKEEETYIKSEVKKVKSERKNRKKLGRRQWWAENWVSVVSLIIAFASMIISVLALLR